MNKPKVVRVAAGQGFWGDWLEAPVRQVNGGPIDYLMMDYLAEVTMSIMQKQKERDPKTGYARDVVPLLQRILPQIVQRNIRVTTNAGGVNPGACAAAIAETARSLGLAGKLKIGVVSGDDILGRLDDLIARGIELKDMDTGRPLSDVRANVLSANAYLGARPAAEALAKRPQGLGRVGVDGLEPVDAMVDPFPQVLSWVFENGRQTRQRRALRSGRGHRPLVGWFRKPKPTCALASKGSCNASMADSRYMGGITNRSSKVQRDVSR